MKWPCILFFLLLPLFAKAQEGFISHYDFGHPGMVFTNLILTQDTLVVSGIAIQDTFPYKQVMTLTKLDTNGNILAHFQYQDSLGGNYSLGETPRGLLRCLDGSGYLLLGHVFERSTGIAMKVDNDGNQVWLREYTDSNSSQDFFRKIVEINDGYLISGMKQALDNKLDLFVKKVDYNGAEIWERSYGKGNARDDIFDSMLIRDANEYVIGSSNQPYMVPWQQFESRIKIFAIDSVGNIKWSWLGEPYLDEVWLDGLNINVEGNWIYATVRAEFEMDGFMKRQPRVVVRDGNFNIVNAVDLDDMDANGNFILNMLPLENGDFLGLGKNNEKVPNPVLAEDHGYAWMVRMEYDGDTLWERKDLVFPDSIFATGQYLHSAVELSSGSIIAAGYYDSSADPKNWGILIKVDKDGCIDTLLCSGITPVEEVHPAVEVRVWPNPASSHVDFYFQNATGGQHRQLLITDLAGRPVQHFALPEGETSLRWNAAEVPPGVYFYRYMENGVLLKAGKIVVGK